MQQQKPDHNRVDGATNIVILVMEYKYYYLVPQGFATVYHIATRDKISDSFLAFSSSQAIGFATTP